MVNLIRKHFINDGVKQLKIINIRLDFLGNDLKLNLKKKIILDLAIYFLSMTQILC